MKWLSGYLSLFASSATLVCCALPALFVALGMGAVLAGFVSHVPQVVWLSEHKVWVFSVAGMLLTLNTVVRIWNRSQVCEIGTSTTAVCQTTRDYSGWVHWIAVALFVAGGFFAYGLPLLIV